MLLRMIHVKIVTVRSGPDCNGICPFKVACGEGHIPSWLNLRVFTDFAAECKVLMEL